MGGDESWVLDALRARAAHSLHRFSTIYDLGQTACQIAKITKIRAYPTNRSIANLLVTRQASRTFVNLELFFQVSHMPFIPVVSPKFSNLVPRSAVMQNAPTSQVAAAPFKPSKPTLFDVPISNNGGRIRFLLYKKSLEDTVHILAPKELGGLKSEAYLALNPLGKMPLLVLPDGTPLPESQVIESYILDKYKGVGPDLVPDTPELRALAALAARVHDLYIAPIQGCLYRQMEAVDRAKNLKDIAFQLDVLESLVKGPFFCGNEISYADSALMPTFVFLTFILPRYFGWASVFTGRPKLQAWWDTVKKDEAAARVIKEIEGGLSAWEESQRWKTLGICEQIANNTEYDWTCGGC